MGNSLVDLSKLTKPATVLIEKISDATGVLYEPTRIRRKAKAEADASKTKALMDLEIEEIQKRALNRLVTEEIKKQENIENITEKSFDSLKENATPENIEDDWISNFFDKCKLISDEEMQILWAQILAGESNNPGTFSKRTIEFISTLDKSDALLFDNLLRCCWIIGDYQPFIIDYQDNQIYQKNNINFSTLSHLDEIGLISFNPISGFKKVSQSDTVTIEYFGKLLNLDFKNINPYELQTGMVNLTKIGADLARVNHPTMKNNRNEYIDDFYHYIVEKIF